MIKVGMPEGQLFVYQADNTAKKFILKDGSAVWLNKHSKLMLPENFNRRTRSVSIEGEAYFEVANNAEFPFIISTGNTFIKVIGTAFNVKAVKSDLK
jgi:ferric-dicitrate binding protein FerR (iron transport regulator)